MAPPNPAAAADTCTNTNTITPTTTRPVVFHRPNQYYAQNPNYPQLRDPNQIASYLTSRPPFVFPHPNQNHPAFIGRPLVSPRLIKPMAAAAAAGHSILLESNAHRDLRGRNWDDASVVLVRDRKIRLHDNDSLYSMCRSWLRNGFPEETRPQYLDAASSLPRPLPLAAEVENPTDKKEGDKEEEEEDIGSSENLTAEKLLRSHVKRAKRIRSRLREQRLERITRYKTRLALLLPPIVDQNMRNETN